MAFVGAAHVPALNPHSLANHRIQLSKFNSFRLVGEMFPQAGGKIFLARRKKKYARKIFRHAGGKKK